MANEVKHFFYGALRVRAIVRPVPILTCRCPFLGFFSTSLSVKLTDKLDTIAPSDFFMPPPPPAIALTLGDESYLTN